MKRRYERKKILNCFLSWMLVTALIWNAFDFSSFSGTVKAEETNTDISLGISSLIDPAMAMDKESIWADSDGNGTSEGCYVYYGRYYQNDTNGDGIADTSDQKEPIQWRVLDTAADGNGDGQKDSVFLFSNWVLDQMSFNEDSVNDGNTWESSNLRRWLNSLKDNEGNYTYQESETYEYTEHGFLDTAFLETEKKAMVDAVKQEGTGVFLSGTQDVYLDNPALEGDKLFCLSGEEAIRAKYGFFPQTFTENSSGTISISGSKTTKLGISEFLKNKLGSGYRSFFGGAYYWWLRSASAKQITSAGQVNYNGAVMTTFVNSGYVGVAPAFYLNQSSILLTSAASGGKSSTVISSSDEDSTNDSLTEVKNTSNQKWKVTLQDDSIAAPQISGVQREGNCLSFDYSGVRTGLNQKLSAIITSGSGETERLVSYGVLADESGTTATGCGSVSFQLPENFDTADYSLKVFSEQTNGDYCTDYAGTLAVVNSNPTLVSTTPPVPTPTEPIVSTAPPVPTPTEPIVSTAPPVPTPTEPIVSTVPPALVPTEPIVSTPIPIPVPSSVPDIGSAPLPTEGVLPSFVPMLGVSSSPNPIEDSSPMPVVTPDKNITSLVENLDVSEETAIKIQAVADRLDIPQDTIIVTDETITSQKTDEDVPGSYFVHIRARTSQITAHRIKLTWNHVKEADGYLVYGNRCNTGGKIYPYKLLKTIKNGGKRVYTQKKLKTGSYYKYVVRAYKLIDGKKVSIAVSKTIHATTDGGQYGNAKAVKLNKTKVDLSQGDTFRLKAEEIKQDKDIRKHRNIKFESNNKKVASVSGKGVIKAKSAGSCTIYTYAQSGVYKKMKVTVEAKK